MAADGKEVGFEISSNHSMSGTVECSCQSEALDRAHSREQDGARSKC